MNWHLRTYCGVVIDDFLWFSNNTYNGLFKMNIKTYVIELVDFFPAEDALRWGMHKTCIRYNNSIVFLPSYGEHIHIYDTLRGAFTVIDFQTNPENEEIDKISDAVLIEDEIYILPLTYKNDLKILNLRDNTITAVPAFLDQAKKAVNIPQRFIITRCQTDTDNNLRFAFYGTDILAVWNPKDNILSTRHCGIHHLFSSHLIDDDIFLLTEDNFIYRLDKDNYLIKYNFTPHKTEYIGRIFNRIIGFNETVIILPAFYDWVTCISDGDINDVIKIHTENDDSVNAPISFNVVEVEGCIWILPFLDSPLYIVGGNMKSVAEIPFMISDSGSKEKILLNLLDQLMKENYILEDNDFNLDLFLNNLNY